KIGRGIEIADRRLAARERAPLVEIDGREALDAVPFLERPRQELAAGGARARNIDLRRGDPAGELVAQRIGLRAGDGGGERLDLLGPGGIALRLHVEAVAARVLRRARLSRAGARPGAEPRVAPVGLDPGRAGHAGAARVDKAGTSNRPSSASSSSA